MWWEDTPFHLISLWSCAPYMVLLYLYGLLSTPLPQVYELREDVSRTCLKEEDFQVPNWMRSIRVVLSLWSSTGHCPEWDLQWWFCLPGHSHFSEVALVSIPPLSFLPWVSLLVGFVQGPLYVGDSGGRKSLIIICYRYVWCMKWNFPRSPGCSCCDVPNNQSQPCPSHMPSPNLPPRNIFPTSVTSRYC